MMMKLWWDDYPKYGKWYAHPEVSRDATLYRIEIVRGAYWAGIQIEPWGDYRLLGTASTLDLAKGIILDHWNGNGS